MKATLAWLRTADDDERRYFGEARYITLLRGARKYKSAVKLGKRPLQDQHGNVSTKIYLYTDVAHCLRAQAAYDEAVEFIHQALTFLRQAAELKQVRFIVEVELYYCLCLSYRGDEVTSNFERVVASQETSLPNEHGLSIRLRYHLACGYAHLGQMDKSVQTLTSLYEQYGPLAFPSEEFVHSKIPLTPAGHFLQSMKLYYDHLLVKGETVRAGQVQKCNDAWGCKMLEEGAVSEFVAHGKEIWEWPPPQ